jgi:hypothetical protein
VPAILVATSAGLHRFDDTGRPGPVDFRGRDVTGLAPSRDEVWAVLDRSEVWHAPDLVTWRRVADLAGHRATCIVAIGGQVFVGSSGARLFRLVDEHLEAVASFDAAEGRSGWYTPWGGPPDTRSIANWDETVYVNVHVGGILRGDVGLGSWTPTIEVDADVHQVQTAEGLVLAACAGGLGVSADRGATWAFRTEGLAAPYSRAVAVVGDSVLVSASDGPRGGHAGIYRGDLAGGRLERCRDGLPEWFEDNIDTYCLDADPEVPFAAFGTADGRVFTSEDSGRGWGELASGLPGVRRVLALP